jgi:hypothetical protein
MNTIHAQTPKIKVKKLSFCFSASVIIKCDMDFVLYPLDVQKCAVDFSSCKDISLPNQTPTLNKLTLIFLVNLITSIYQIITKILNRIARNTAKMCKHEYLKYETLVLMFHKPIGKECVPSKSSVCESRNSTNSSNLK